MAVRFKELPKMKDLKFYDSGEGLSVSKGESEHIRMSKSKRFDNLKVKCFTCIKPTTT